MPRRPRVITPGVAHHVTKRGNNRRSVLLSTRDRAFYPARLTHNDGTRVLAATPDCRGPWNHTEGREILPAGVSETDSYAIRPATLTGEPLGSTEFVARLERETARRLRVLARGRPRLSRESVSIGSATAAQTCWFAGKD